MCARPWIRQLRNMRVRTHAHREHTSTPDFLRCHFCTTHRFAAFAPPAWCEASHGRAAAGDAATISAFLLNYAEKIHGLYWRNETSASIALTHLLRYMPRRDTLQLFAGTDTFLIDFVLEEHIRLALYVREGAGAAWARDQESVPDAIWLDYVLPYAFLNEKRDVGFGWRAKFLRIFQECIMNSLPQSIKCIKTHMNFVAHPPGGWPHLPGKDNNGGDDARGGAGAQNRARQCARLQRLRARAPRRLCQRLCGRPCNQLGVAICAHESLATADLGAGRLVHGHSYHHGGSRARRRNPRAHLGMQPVLPWGRPPLDRVLRPLGPAAL